MKVLNPATGAVLAELKESDPLSIGGMAARARGAQREWARTPLEDRLGVVRRFRELLVERKEELARTLTSEVGKPIAQSRNEIEGTLGRIDFFLEKVPQVLRDEVVHQDAAQRLEERITLEPLGVIANIGSYATGKAIAEAVAGRMIRVQLELGGKDPVYVCDDVDVRAAAEATADGAFYNTGQSCCAVERIYVHRRIFEPFVQAFVETVKGFKVGDPMDPATYIGPLARAAQVAVLEDQVVDATGKGAKVLVGGRRMDRPGNYFEPTVLVDVDHGMKVMRDESFGPIIGIMGVDGDEQAVEQMRDTEYGLTAGVYSQDRSRAERILSQMDTGTAYWNCCDRVSPRLPWSGRGHSGIGTTLSTHGIQTFLQPRAWHLRG